MAVSVRHEGGCTVVAVDGALEVDFAAWLGTSVAWVCHDDPTARVVVDLTGVGDADPRAVAALGAAWSGPLTSVVVVLPSSGRRGSRDRLRTNLPTAATVADAVARLAGMAPLGTVGLRHEALLYSGAEELAGTVAAFVLDAIDAAEPVLVGLSAAKQAMVRALLGEAAGHPLVEFADMDVVGSNPALILPACSDFTARRGREGSTLRGVGEPIWPGRRPPDVVEAQRHETLVNLALAHAPLWLLCPYDTEALDEAVIAEALHSHPWVVQDRVTRRSDRYASLGPALEPFAEPLPEPPGQPDVLRFDHRSLHEVTATVAREAARAGFWAHQVHDLVRAVGEVATNSVLHGGGTGQLRVWTEAPDGVVCEVRDRGHITEPMVGRQRPADPRDARRGLWLANQLCDLVQIRSDPDGTTVRLHMRFHLPTDGLSAPERN